VLAASGGSASPLVVYTITEKDTAGPFTPEIPRDLIAQSKLPHLGYRTALEAIAEQFHSSPNLLKRLNPGATFEAGSEIQVPNVIVNPAPPQTTGQQSDTGAATSANSGNVTVTIAAQTGSLTVTDGSGRVVMFAPVTSGSEHDPLPIGNWKVTVIQQNPPFHYNPELFWDANPAHTKAKLPPGPNGPVGVVWIGLDKEHYGIHGTPEPSAIGRTASHGCVRLTNWDAERLAALVTKGTPVIFQP